MRILTIGLPIEFDVDVTNGVEGWGDDEKINIGSNDLLGIDKNNEFNKLS